MKHADLERTYKALALKIDEVGKDKSGLFLAKLVFLLVRKIDVADDIHKSIDDAALSLAT
ncbi:MAG: hypothetical protein AB8B64_05520 [Granulosicoccus sp.]